MWDSLGVLALTVGAGFVRAEAQLRSLVRRPPSPRLAAFSLGGAIVPYTLDVRPVSLLRDLLRRLLIRPERSDPRHAAPRLRAAREGLGLTARALSSVPGDGEAVPLRVTLDDDRPPVAVAVLKLAAWLVMGALAISGLVLALGTMAVRTVLGFLG